jgi:cytochrome P450
MADVFHPHARLAALREERPLCPLQYPDGHVGWLVTSHALGRAVLGDPRFSQHPPRFPVDVAGLLEALEAGPESAGDLLFMDPPEHTRLRRQQSGYFTVRRIDEHTNAVERIVDARLDAMEKAGPPIDLVDAFALPVASATICELLGVPHEDGERFLRPSAVLMAGSETTAAEKQAAMAEFYDYVRDVLEERRRQRRRDLLSELVAAGELSDDELTGLAFVLFVAGHDTTASMLALSTYFLLYDRRRWEALAADPSSVEGVTEELLRYLTITPAGIMARTATEDVELAGIVIRAGESVTVHTGAANRDAGRFDDPDEFDPGRDARAHLSFAHGRHMCLGQHVARLELRLGLRGLAQRLPTLRLAVPSEQVPMRDGIVRYGVERLPVEW